MARLPVALILLSILVAGCLGGADPLETPGTAPGDDEVPGPGTPEHDDAVKAGRVAPAWAPGHYWSYETTMGTGFGLAVSHDHGENWYLDTTSAGLAWRHVQSELSIIGEIRKTDLAGRQGSERVAFLSFPLDEGKTWTTKWDGAERTVKVAATGTTFLLEAYEGEDLRVRYTYDPAVLWLREMVFFTAEGETTLRITLSEHTKGWAGEVYRWRGDLLMSHTHTGQSIASQQAFAVPEDTGELWTSITWRCGGDTGLLLVSVTPHAPDATEEAFGLQAECEAQEITIVGEPSAGDWSYQVLATSGAEDGTLDSQIWARTLDTFQAPW
jgi:hypothetical protein